MRLTSIFVQCASTKLCVESLAVSVMLMPLLPPTSQEQIGYLGKSHPPETKTCLELFARQDPGDDSLTHMSWV